MLKEVRQNKIVEYVNRNQFVKFEQLVELTKCSLITIRRDIQDLSEAGLIKKMHGGVKSIDSAKLKMDVSVLKRSVENIETKVKMAECVSKKIPKNAKIYLDAGSSVNCLIPFLKGLSVTVYTHGIHHLTALAENDIETIVIGGRLKSSTMANIGAKTLKEIAKCRFDCSILGVNAFHAAFGFSTPDEEEGLIKKEIIRNSMQNFALIDQSKFKAESFYSFANDQDEIIIITDFVDKENEFPSYHIENI